VIISLDKTLIHGLKPFEQFALKVSFRPWTFWFPLKSIIWRKMLECSLWNYQQKFFQKWTTPLKHLIIMVH